MLTDEVKPDFREAKKKAKVKKTWKIEFKYKDFVPFPCVKKWLEWDKYRTQKQRDQAFDALIRSHSGRTYSEAEFRKIDPERK